MPTKIFAHRGASHRFPENTMIAFIHALNEGADGIELDVHLTEEGIPVVIHDESLERTTDGNGLIKKLTLEKIKEVSAGKWKGRQFEGEKIPTLEEVLEWINPTHLLLNIELKNNVIQYIGLEEKVLKLVKRYNMEHRVIYSSFNHESMKKVKELDPHAETALLYQKEIKKPWSYAKVYGATGVHPEYKLVDRIYVLNMHFYKIAIRPWTVNNPRIMKKLMRWQIDSIITDNPAKAVAIRNKLFKK